MDGESIHEMLETEGVTMSAAVLLSHTAGLQREPYGDVWDVLVAPDDAALLADLARAERVLPNARGTAPGLIHEDERLGTTILRPGVPGEMR